MNALMINDGRDQAAAAIRLARAHKAGGGDFAPKAPKAPRAPVKMHVGPIHSAVAGRTDHLPMHVPSGSYVLPADIVSAHGEGNTMAGMKVMRRMFGGTPYGIGSGPYGQKGGPYGSGKHPYSQEGGPYGEPLKASGGEHSDGSVPIVAAGGEYVLTPDEVRYAGDGDLSAGHKALDAFVLRTRADLIKTSKNLPGPKTS